jgi:BNR repeat-like domain
MRHLATAAIALVASLIIAAPVAAAAWTQPTLITGTHDAFPSYARSLAVAGDRVHLVDSRTNGQIEYRRSSDDGNHWSAPVILAQPDARFTSVLGDPAIAARGSLVVVAYRAHDATAAYLFIRRSTDGGETWGRPRQLARVVTDRRIGEQSVAISSAGIFIVWTNRVTGAIDLRRSTDGGRHFSAVHRIGITTYTFSPGDPTFTDGLIGLAATGDDVYLAWTPSGSGPADSIVLSRSGDGGSTFHSARTIVDRPTYGWPSLSAAGPFLVGEFQATDGSVWFLHSSDRGHHVGTRRLADPSTSSTVFEGSVAVNQQGGTLVSYSRSGLAASPDAPLGDILVRRSHDGGDHLSHADVAASDVTGLGNIDTALTDRGSLLVFSTCQDAAFTVCDVASVRRS